ncbi:DUF4917 family protein [Achromobacter xylosoxidans]|uniref:DUF4917 family protein n=1 Tax=Alcaligenes xylosoxydans xylosoxydans TaxID=85698 RepID=UPI0015648CBC|nr:DUF4917 family protein [Achromobacter xylosoxidans]
MDYKIHNWSDICERFTGAVVLGNGASMAVSKKFSYKSLLQHVRDSGALIDDIQSLFDYFVTSDFELILRIIWQATNVNKSLKIADARTRNAYLKVRECLITAVREVHPEHDEIRSSLPRIYKYLKSFDTIISLNYDLIPYWATTYGLDIEDGHAFKDCFISGVFDSDWRRFKEPIGREEKVSLVFYPHGNLVLCRNRIEEERKLRSGSASLLKAVLSAWQSEDYVPLFVSEGTKEQKVRAIRGSHYLSVVYREVLPAPKLNLTIYGWDIGEHDIHILKRLYDPLLARVAVSVYENNQAYCHRIRQLINQEMRDDIEVVFFDSRSQSCWSNE